MSEFDGGATVEDAAVLGDAAAAAAAPPTEEQTQQAAIEASRANLQSQPLDQDPTYTRNQMMFFNWVDMQRAAGRIAPGPKRITTANVNLFFNTVLATKPWSKPVMRKMISSLQKYANMREHAGENFIVETPLVQQAIVSQQKYYASLIRQRNSTRDP